MRQLLLRVSAKVAVSALGGAFVVLGVALLFLPGPGVLVLIAGLALLAREYLWARRLRDRLNARAAELRRRARRNRPTTTRMVGGAPAPPAATPGPLGESSTPTPARDDVPAV